MLRRGFAVVFLIGCASGSARAEKPELKALVDLRWRQEKLDTLSANPILDPTYSFGNLRLRFGLDVNWSRISAHGLGQAAGSYSLPANGSSGIGTTYFTASGGEDVSPGQMGLAELSVRFEITDSLSASGGRLAHKEGVETLTGNSRFDWIKLARLSERLIGTWDWVNVGRRFDGGEAALDRESWKLSAFGARVLQGGVDYQHAFERLEGVDVYSFVLTSKRGAWLPGGEVRLFNIAYRDARSSTRTSLGDRLLIDGLGGSLVEIYPAGPGELDILAWVTYEFGHFGVMSHHAMAVIGEGGYAWPKAPFAPWVRGGLAYASGDGDPGDQDHETFFNMVPTNHKFYGDQDLSALQNLTNVYGQLRLQPHPRLVLNFEGHFFRLSDGADAWYGGSGPANNQEFGYVARLPHGGGQTSIGTEWDFTLTWMPRAILGVQVGASHFEGGEVAQALFPIKDSTTWLHLQAVWTP
jgi:hypothetical protein